MSADEIGIGSTIYFFDQNRRVYRPGGGGGPIWRERWRPITIASESPRLWKLAWGGKVPKKGPWPESYARSIAEIDELEWAHLNRWRIEREIRTVDVGVLRAVAELIGYKPPEVQS